MPGLIGKKLGMTSVFSADGELIPVTIVQAGPCKVVSIRTKEKDGYEALQLGFLEKKEKNITKPLLGHFKKNNVSATAVLKEFKGYPVNDYNTGDELKSDIFTIGEKIKIRGRTKGKGFQGVMKRHGFGGVGGTTHGQSDRLRAPGSIGSSSYPSRVFKGQRMAGRTGFTNVTVANLQIVRIVPEENILLIRGAIPGAINSIIELIKK